MLKLETEISEYPEDYKLYLNFSDAACEFVNEADGQKILSFELSLEELIKAGEWAKKFKEASQKFMPVSCLAPMRSGGHGVGGCTSVGLNGGSGGGHGYGGTMFLAGE